VSTDIAALKDEAQKRQLGWRGREPGQDGPHMQVLPSDILTLIERIEAAENGQRRLAEAIRNAAVRAGILRESAALTGPMLMLLCDDLASMTKQDRCAVNHHNMDNTACRLPDRRSVQAGAGGGVMEPCPFCGGNDLNITSVHSDDWPVHEIAKAVRCSDCCAKGRHHNPIGWAESEREAVEAWNTRAVPTVGTQFHDARRTTVVVPGLDEAERSALARFNETINDDGTYDISKAMIHRLADKGAVRHLSAGKYQITQAGCAMLGEFPIEVGQSQAGGKLT